MVRPAIGTFFPDPTVFVKKAPVALAVLRFTVSPDTTPTSAAEAVLMVALVVPS